MKFKHESSIEGITIADAAKRLGVSYDAVRLAIKAGTIEKSGKRYDGCILVKEETLKNFKRKQRRPVEK